MGISIALSFAAKNPNSNTKNYVYTVAIPLKLDEKEILKMIPYECSIKLD